MRVAFVAANRERLPSPVVPLGLVAVATACPERHERHVLDLCFEDDPIAALQTFVERVRPDVVALGLRNVHDNDYADTRGRVDEYRALVAAIREVSDAKVVLGGGGYTLLARELLEETGADFGVAGEGELAFAQLLDALEAREGVERVGGVHRFVDGQVFAPTRPAAGVDLERTPFPDRRWVDRRHYVEVGTESVQTKRGCRMRCSYCTYPEIEGRLSRLRPPELVARELDHVAEVAPEVDHVFVVDAVFNLPRPHALAVCDALIARDRTIPWTCYVNPIDFGAPLAERMAAAGCLGMEIGSDSGSDAVLGRLRKGFDTRAVRRTSEVARAAGLRDCHTFLLGTPGETLDDVRRTLDFVADLDPSAAILMVWKDAHEPVDAARERERVKLREETLALLEANRDRNPRWVIPPLDHRFSDRLFSALRRQGLRGPAWLHLG